jgi:TolB-like protein/DNA-binding winged helix-turn-helix (wHTH) protein
MPATIHKFGDFELDRSRFELRRNGRLLKLERIPMELLLLLLEKDGQIVSRQEIVERVWGRDVFVDTEHGINTAVRKIRAALREDIEHPRFIQTVSGKGYRFMGEPRNGNGNSAAPTTEDVAEPRAETQPLRAHPASSEPVRHAIQKAPWLATITISLLLIAGVLLGFNVAGVRDKIFSPRQIRPIHSIAVLPLTNLSGDSSQDYYADGMTDELITALARNQSLRVVSRTSAMQYKGVNKPLRDIAQALGVDGILEGSVNRSGNNVHVNLQLIYAPTDTHVWAESYNRDVTGAVSLPEEVSRTVAREATAALSPPLPQRYVNPAAHDAYLQGRYLWFAGNNEESRKYFEKAIQLQPEYAPGWSGLSASILAGGEGVSPIQNVVDQAEAAARKAIELDASFAEGHHALAAVYFFGKWDWDRADAESRRSLQLDPNFSEAHHLHSYILFAMNRPEEAMKEQKRATDIDPFERPWALGRAYYRVRRYDDAIQEFRMRAQAGSSALWVHYFLSKVYGFKHMDEESVQELEEDARIHRGEKVASEFQRAYESGGRRAVLQLRLNDLRTRSRTEYVSPFDLAEACADLGMKDKTLRYLEDAYREHALDLVFLQQEPNFDFLHSDERYRALVKKIGMPPTWGDLS